MNEGYEQAFEVVASMLHEEGWLERLDADTMRLVLERLNEHRPDECRCVYPDKCFCSKGA